MKSILVLVLFFVCPFGYSQVNYFTYQTVKKDNRFSFPILSSSKNPTVVKRINQLLQISELSILKGFETKNIFENAIYNNGTIYGGRTSLDFVIQSNSEKILSLKLDESSCGMTCTYWVRYYNFNSGNGDVIQLKDLFTAKTYKEFYSYVTNKRVSQMKNELLKVSKEEKETLSDIVDHYKNDDLADFYIKDNHLYIDGENCFSKHQKGHSVENICKFKLSEFSKYLNDYGKSLFSLSNEQISSFRSNLLPQLFYGKIGNEDILMVLKDGYPNTMKGEYVYMKYGKGIYLDGTLKANLLSLTENDDNLKDKGIINGVFQNNKLSGTWSNIQQTKSYIITAVKK